MPRKHDHYHAHDSGAHAHEHDEGHHGAPFGRKVVEVEELDAKIAEVFSDHIFRKTDAMMMENVDLSLLLKRSIEEVEARKRDGD